MLSGECNRLVQFYFSIGITFFRNKIEIRFKPDDSRKIPGPGLVLPEPEIVPHDYSGLDQKLPGKILYRQFMASAGVFCLSDLWQSRVL